MEISVHSKDRPSRLACWGRLLAFGTSAVILLGLPGQVSALEARDIDTFVSSYLLAVNPDKRQVAFWEAIGEVSNERKAGRPQKALELATKLASALTEDSKLLSVTQSQIGELYVDLKQWPLAKSHFTNALRLEEAQPDAEIDRFEGPLMWLAGISIQLGEVDVAERHYVRVLEMKQRANGPLHYSVIGQLWALANLALRQSDLPKAEKYIKQELDIWSTEPKFFGVPLGDASKALQNLGSVRAHQGKFSEAISLHLKARDLLQAPIRSASEEGSEIGAGTLARAIECEERLTSLYERTGNPVEAERDTKHRQRFKALVSHPPYVLTHELWHQALLPLP